MYIYTHIYIIYIYIYIEREREREEKEREREKALHCIIFLGSVVYNNILNNYCMFFTMFQR